MLAAGGLRMIDVSDRYELKSWLQQQPAEVSVAVAARAALRNLPVLGLLSSGRSVPKKLRATVVLPVFRAAATALTIARYPGIGGEFAADGSRVVGGEGAAGGGEGGGAGAPAVSGVAG
jgi:hypothetical protein